ncbi:SDR family NAD(P)-dependent oxidoreductase [Dyella sp. 2RAB6]|uniref:SDR family NAD(P)-dependent oxidoreductase n=1 Tax=Dyella sp. 2RAB6 TaxID=3232992 RepID=UPI003F9233B1
MTYKKTIAIFGAGPGLGASLAARFGSEGYRVALVARRAGPLQERVAQLASAGIEAAAFAADLGQLDGIPALVGAIEERFGGIDVAVYAPLPTILSFVAATEVSAAALQSAADLLMYAAVEVSRAVLPAQLKRGDGAVVIVGGLSAVHPVPGLAAIGPLMAAARNYALALNAEAKGQGVYAGSVSIGAMIDRSAGKLALEARGIKLEGDIPSMDPDDIAQEIWTLVTRRDRAEAILPPLPSA